MYHRAFVAATFLAALLSPWAHAKAQGVVLITQAKANAGNVTPGDTAGFPVTITRSGSYALASNLKPGAGRDGIEIKTHNVTIDLNGFSLLGDGIAHAGILGSEENTTVRNGNIAGFLTSAIVDTGAFLIVEDVIIARNGGNGIIAGDVARITGSTVSANDFHGIFCLSSCHVEGNTASLNGRIGVSLEVGTVVGNTIYRNGSGLYGGTRGVGFANNTIINNVSAQVFGVPVPLHPNVICGGC